MASTHSERIKEKVKKKMEGERPEAEVRGSQRLRKNLLLFKRNKLSTSDGK